MKVLKMGFMLFRNKHTESLQPFIFKTVAKAVFFPDGKSLQKKWDEEIDSSLLVKHDYEDVIAENKSIYRWSCTAFEGEKYQLTGHFKPNIAPNKFLSVTGPGKIGAIRRYKYEIPLPMDYTRGNKVDYRNQSTVIFSEGESSTFNEFGTIHSVRVEKKDDMLVFIVDQYYGQDQIDLSDQTWITFDISILVDGRYIIYSTGAGGQW